MTKSNKIKKNDAKKVETPWQAFVVILMLLLTIPVGFGLWKIFTFLQSRFVSSDTLFYGTPEITSIILIIINCIPIIIISACIANVVSWLIPPARRALNKQAKNQYQLTFKDVMTDLFKMFSILTLITLPFNLPCILNYYYFTPEKIVVNSFFAIKEVEYKWPQVELIEGSLSCLRDGGYQSNIEFTFEDNRRLSLGMVSYNGFIEKYKKIKPYITKFVKQKTTDIDEKCLAKYLEYETPGKIEHIRMLNFK